MSKPRHRPVRSCMGCGARDHQSRMVRIARGPGGVVEIDLRGDAPGRGGYLHRVDECLSRFARRKGTARSLRAPVDGTTRAALVSELRRGLSL